jgi:hypothetical protein
MTTGERVTARQREAMDAWSRYLYRKGYTTKQIGVAMQLSQSSISSSLARTRIVTRKQPGQQPDPEPGSAGGWRELQFPPGTALAAGNLNQGGLLTSALLTWQGRNALSVFARRSAEASGEELKDGFLELQRTIEYAQKLQRVLTDPEFAEEVRKDPSYRDDIGHRFGRQP